ncbi:hypothetical protein ACJ72_05514 [Emergomyces africanus]|uniref:Polyprenyldihydroxybenzoate methyltransferase n=1 Tax=Emergomyces africanus TaxID=1955775 RepID=A0A1B7NTP7_9EURO|nr:hypothetical protein ACJ72_05514 [Emergomyces africanus]
MTTNPVRNSAAALRNISLLLRHAPRIRTTTQFDRVRYHSSSSSSVSSDELTHFASLASSWWDPLGPSRILHLMNPLRHEFISSCIAESKPRPASSSSNNEGDANVNTDTNTKSNPNATTKTPPGLRYLDIGCGGGIFAESLARTIPQHPDSSPSMNTNTTSNLSPVTQASSILAIDPSPTMIKIATSHARADPHIYSHIQSGRFKYENTTLEALFSYPSPSPSPSSSSSSSSSPSPQPTSQTPPILEHVNPLTSSPRSFLKKCVQLLQPGGWLIGSTIARTIPSYIVNQVIAEAPWPIGVVPRGTHEWGKFVNDGEVKRWVGIDGGGNEGGIDDVVRWKCVGAMYFPGLGWKMIPGTERLGNYFWAVQKGWQ